MLTISLFLEQIFKKKLLNKQKKYVILHERLRSSWFISSIKLINYHNECILTQSHYIEKLKKLQIL